MKQLYKILFFLFAAIFFTSAFTVRWYSSLKEVQLSPNSSILSKNELGDIVPLLTNDLSKKSDFVLETFSNHSQGTTSLTFDTGYSATDYFAIIQSYEVEQAGAIADLTDVAINTRLSSVNGNWHFNGNLLGVLGDWGDVKILFIKE